MVANTLITNFESMSGPGSAAIQRVFLSSTVRDLEEYRKGVKDALNKFRVQCYLSEEWINAYGDTVQKCQQELQKADAYIGIFAYWYGSIPTGYDRSITHLEFEWACKKWDEFQPPPIAVFMPKQESKAEKVLREKAMSLLQGQAYNGQDHATRLKAFHDTVTGSWRPVNYFKDKHELREGVMVFCYQSQGERPLEAATGAVQVSGPGESVRIPTDEELGLLGRKDQLETVRQILSQMARYLERVAQRELLNLNRVEKLSLFPVLLGV